MKSSKTGFYDPESFEIEYRLIRQMFKEERISRGLVQGHVADHVGVSTAMVSEYETEHSMPSLRRFFAWADSLGYGITTYRK